MIISTKQMTCRILMSGGLVGLQLHRAKLSARTSRRSCHLWRPSLVRIGLMNWPNLRRTWKMPAKLTERVWNALIPYTILGSTINTAGDPYQRNKDRGFYQQLTNYSPAESLQIQFTTQIKGALFACKMENRFSSISPGRTINHEIFVTIDYDKTVPTHLAVSICLNTSIGGFSTERVWRKKRR